MLLKVFFTIIPFILITYCSILSQAKIIHGTINTADSFYYIGSFVFNQNTTNGAGNFGVSITHHKDIDYGMAVYYYQKYMTDIRDSKANCLQRIHLSWGKTSMNYFTTSEFKHRSVDEQVLKDNPEYKDMNMVTSYISLDFNINRPRWFYVALTNCAYDKNYYKNLHRIKYMGNEADKEYFRSNTSSIYKNLGNITLKPNQGPIYATFNFTFTNGNVMRSRHFSFNEFDDLLIAITFFIIYLILFATYLCMKKKAPNRSTSGNGSSGGANTMNDSYGYGLVSQHKTVTFLGISVLLQLIGNCIDVIRLNDYSDTGIQDETFRYFEAVSLGFHHMSDVVFVLDILLIAKGWTVIRRKISANGRVKLAIAMTTYTICGIFAINIYQNLKDEDRIDQSSLYSSDAGYVIVILRCLIFCWYMRSAYTTFTKPSFKRKKRFYFYFFIASICYLIIVPLVFVISDSSQLYNRTKHSNWASNILITLGHMSFLYLFWPSNYNTYFPFAFETKEQEMARMDAFKRQSETLFNRQAGATISNGNNPENNINGVEHGFGPQYNTTTTTNNNSTKNIRKRSSHRVSRASISGGSQNVSPRANITSLSQSLKSKIKVIYDYSEDLDEAISLFFDEEEDVNMHQKE